MMKIGYNLLLAIMMLCTSGSPSAAAETAPQKYPDQTKFTQTVQSLEKRVSKLENDPHFSFEAQNRLIDKSRESYEARLDGFNKQITAQQASTSREISIFMAAVGAFLAFLTLLATLLGPKAIKSWIDDKANEMTKNRLDEVVTEETLTSILQPKVDTITKQILVEFRKKAEEEIEKIHNLRKMIEEMPEKLKRSLTERQEEAVSKVDKIAEEKPVDFRSYDDWLAIGMKAYQDGRVDDTYKAFLQAMHIEETPSSIDNAGLAAYVAGHFKEAEELYKHSIEISPLDDSGNGNYAIVLVALGRYSEAEKIYLKMLEEDAANVNALGNYSQMLLAQGRAKGEDMLRTALKLSPEDSGLLTELNFYRFAHFPNEGAEALAELKRLLLDGVRSRGWNLAPNVERAIKDGHPNPELLQTLADVISKDAPLEGLDKFAEWKAA